MADASLLVRTARAADLHPRLSAYLRGWMAQTLMAWPPYRSVAAAAKDLHGSADSLRVHWTKEVGGSNPNERLEWIKLVRAIEGRRGAGSWTQVAGQLEITRRTLERIGRRCAGCRLSELAANLDGYLRDAGRYFAAVLSGGA